VCRCGDVGGFWWCRPGVVPGVTGGCREACWWSDVGDGTGVVVLAGCSGSDAADEGTGVAETAAPVASDAVDTTMVEVSEPATTMVEVTEPAR
jgi:hypothetical protein